MTPRRTGRGLRCCALALLLALSPGGVALAAEPGADVPAGSYLGIHARSNSNVLEARNVYAGITVTRVVENSPAAAAGVQVGDVLLAANDVELDAPARLDDLVASLPPGSGVELRLERDGRVRELQARTVPRLPEPPESAKGIGSAMAPEASGLRVERRYLGFEFRAADPERLRALDLSPSFGVEVERVPEQSPLRAAGIGPGDLITEIDGRPIPSPQELLDFLGGLEGRERLALTVFTPEGNRRDVDVELYEPPRQLTRLRLPPLFSLVRDKDTSEYSALLGLFRWTRLPNGSRLRLLWFFEVETGSPDELIDMGTGS